MYTETRNNFSLRNVILQFLFIALFVFILIWLFPTKNDVKKANKNSSNDEKITINNNDTSILLDRIFNENLMSMKEAAQSYYTTERLPQKVGDSVKITLKEMLDKKIILPFKDKNGKQCDLENSYVKITKKDNEFVMKVNLKCGSEENYLLTYMGCYDYCSKTICEKKGYVGKVYNVPSKTTPKKYSCQVVNGKYYDKNGNVVSKANYDKSCSTIPVTPEKYTCKVVNGKYYDRNGNVVSKATYDEVCFSHKCDVVNGKYFDDKGNVVSKEAYKQACEKQPEYYCRIVNGHYYDSNGNEVDQSSYKKSCACREFKGNFYDKNGNIVSKDEYLKSCFDPEPDPKYTCKVVNGKYYDKQGNVTTKEGYEESCYEHVCKIVNGHYYDINGKKVTKTEYEHSCYDYEYCKTTDGTVKYGEWSEWSESIVNPTNKIEVQKKTQTIKKRIGYNVKTVNDLTKPIYETKKVIVATTTTKVCSLYNVTTTVNDYKEEYVGTVKLTSAPTSTAYIRYEKVGAYNWYCDPNCTSGTVYLYKVYKRTPNTSTSYSCAKYETYTKAYESTDIVQTGYAKKEEKTPVYETYTKILYRYRTKTTTPGSTDCKWNVYNYTKLLNAGYKYSGKTRLK